MTPVEINLNSGAPVVGNGNVFSGAPGRMLFHNGWDPGVLRPFVGSDGRSYVTRNVGHKADGTPILQNAYSPNPALLRKEEWTLLDQTVIRVAKERLSAWGQLVSAGSTYNIPNGLRVPILQHQRVSDITPATVSFDGLRRSERDRPQYDLQGLPLPIIHKDLSFSLRELEISRNGSSPLDLTSAELAARRVAEEVEKMTLGIDAGFSYGGYSIYGFTNYPDRITTTMTNPESSSWNPQKTVDEMIKQKDLARAAKFYGPFFVFASGDWERHLDRDYSSAYGNMTLRDRLARIKGFVGIETHDYLTGYQMGIVQVTPDVARAVTGMQLTTLQWEENGGMEVNWKIMCIMVPQLRSDLNGNTGIVHGTAPAL